MSPFDHRPEDALHLIQYRPHGNCHKVATFCKMPNPDAECDGVGNTDLPFVLPDGNKAEPGDWIATRDYKSFELVTADDLLDYIKGTTHTRLEA